MGIEEAKVDSRMAAANEKGGAVRVLALLAVGFTLGLAALASLKKSLDYTTGSLPRQAPTTLERAVYGSPSHLLLVVRGLEVANLPGRFAHWSLAEPAFETSVKVELLLDTRILGGRGDKQTYQINSRLVAVDRGDTIWSRVYAGELLNRRTIRLQLNRAVGDAIMFTKLAERSQLMVGLDRSRVERPGRTQVLLPARRLSFNPALIPPPI